MICIKYIVRTRSRVYINEYLEEMTATTRNDKSEDVHMKDVDLL